VQLKRLDAQVMVITGASSGIGLVTAKGAARAGARVVLAARNERDLERAVGGIVAQGGRAMYAVADVAELADVERIAATAIETFGRIDTWVNGAAVALYGQLMEIPLRDMRRLFDVNFWGVVHGCTVAVPHLRENGGAIINIGSVLADRALPLQGVYSAAKHAMKAYTDTLRMELEAGHVPISVSLVKPASIDTPFFQKARSYLGADPRPIPPVYAPEVVAEAILECAQHPVRDVFVGGAARALSAADALAPRLTDVVMEHAAFALQRADSPRAQGHGDNLYVAMADDAGERGSTYAGHVMHSSAYTSAALHPRATLLGAAGLGLAIAASLRARRRLGGRARESELPTPEAIT
jgi:NAD(P)-dependent dehydrogenase (short-subunit alcohol dehydrogenase family)